MEFCLYLENSYIPVCSNFTILHSNLPEVASTHEVLGVPSVSARFGTDPALWNWGMSAVANFAPEVRKRLMLFVC